MNVAASAMHLERGLVPLVYAGAARRADRREYFHWPVARAEIVAADAEVPGAVLAFAGALTDSAEVIGQLSAALHGAPIPSN